jgi:hypothetical protein
LILYIFVDHKMGTINYYLIINNSITNNFMRRVAFFFCALFVFVCMQGQTNFWENPTLVNENVEKARATFVTLSEVGTGPDG